MDARDETEKRLDALEKKQAKIVQVIKELNPQAYRFREEVTAIIRELREDEQKEGIHVHNDS